MPPKLTHHDIYDAALDDTLFDTLPERLAAEIDVHSALFIWLHPGDYREITAGTQPHAHAHYSELTSQDPWLAHATDDKIGTGAFRLSDYVPADEYEKSTMYNEYVVENRLDRYWCVGLLQSTGDGQVATAFHKGKNAGDFSDWELKSVNRHVDDLGRLHTIRRELHRNSIRELTAADRTLLDETPVFELDHEGRLLRMNGKAETLLRLHPLLFLRFRRNLALAGAAQRDFDRAVAIATGADRSKAGMVDLPLTRAADGRIIPPLRLNLMPRNNGGRRVLVIATAGNEAGLQDFFGCPEETIRLTPRERDVLQGLIRGRRRDQLAHDLDLSVPTVDLHSANLRRKLGARTIPEAVAIAARLGLL
jgi:DNA-binding CsgD family transcriptional regulator